VSEPLRFGVVSTAGINDSLLEACRATGLAEVEAVSSRDAGRAAAYAREHGIPAFHAGHAGLVADPAVEAVYVSAPNALHVEWTVAAIAAGKHVLCEKPFARRSAEARAAVDAAAAAGVTLAEAFMYRHHPQIRDLAGRVAAGELGALRTMRAAFGFTADRPDDILLQPALDGGGLLDVGCYCVSAFRLLAGEPEAVDAEADVGPTGVDLRFRGRVAFAGGVSGEFECGIAMPETHLLEVIGEKGSVRLDDPWVGATTGVDAYALQLEDFVAAVREGRRPLVSGDEIGAQAAALEALLTSTGI
jgi:xylose dehydrogenase (NAD/NADP)